MFTPDLRIKRAYDAPAESDGYRVLVDRLWPRGIKKADAAIDEWMKDVSPSNELRKEYHGHPDRWDAFRERYAAELRVNPLVDDLLKRVRAGRVTLVYAAKVEKRNNAVALREYLLRQLKK